MSEHGPNKSEYGPNTLHYYPNASDPNKVSALNYRIQGDDSKFLVDHFESFLNKRDKDQRPWLAHICFHAIHEPRTFCAS